MTQHRFETDRPANAGRRKPGRRIAALLACGGLLAAGGYAYRHGASGPGAIDPATTASLATSAPSRFDGMLDPRPAMPLASLKLAAAASSSPAFRASATRTAIPAPKDRVTAAVPSSAPVPSAAPVPPPVAEAPRVAALVPLPVPRPPEFSAPATKPPQVAAQDTAKSQDAAKSADIAKPQEVPTVARRSLSRRTRSAAVAAPVDNRSFLEKLFNVPAAAGPGVAYAALGDGALPAAAPAPRFSPLPDLGGGGTATYDISARVVTLPNGERLEAHSGLRDKLDDPRFVHVRMQGATPPGTYELTEREALFHGVRALRLTPVGGADAVHGRAGLLAHTFMLGPNGDSNGCVSFRDYNRFLQAYLRGEIRRLVVVAGSGKSDGPFGRRFTDATPARDSAS